MVFILKKNRFLELREDKCRVPHVVFFNSISWDKVALRGNLLLSSPFVRYDSHHISIHITSLGR